MSAPLIDRQGIAARHGLHIRYVRETLTKLPDFPPPVLRLSQKLVRWNAYEVDRYLLSKGQQQSRRQSPGNTSIGASAGQCAR